MVETQFSAWQHPSWQVHEGRPPQALALDELLNHEHAGHFAHLLATAFDSKLRQGALNGFHFAVTAYFNATVAPFAFDSTVVGCALGDVGVSTSLDNDFGPSWADGVTPTLGNSESVANQCWDQLMLVGHSLGRVAGVHTNGMQVVLYDALELRLLALIRDCPSRVDALREVLRAIPYTPRVERRTVRVNAPDGAPAVVTTRRVCCVLHSTPGCHACPGCPKVKGAEGEATVIDWLAVLDDAEFEDATGRSRVVLQ